MLRDLLVSVEYFAPSYNLLSTYILPNKFSIIYINQKNIESRQYAMNMKVAGVVVLTESSITFN